MVVPVVEETQESVSPCDGAEVEAEVHAWVSSCRGAEEVAPPFLIAREKVVCRMPKTLAR